MGKLLLLLLCAQMAQAALLMPSFGPGSEALDYGDWSGTTVHSHSCAGKSACGAGDGGNDNFLSYPWDGNGDVWANSSASLGLGYVTSQADATGYAFITCYDETCQGVAPFTISMFGSAYVSLKVFVNAPYEGFVTFQNVVDGQHLGTVVVPVAAGLNKIADVYSGANVNLFLNENGTASVAAYHSHDIYNVQWVPEPSTFALCVAGIGLLLFRQRRRFSERLLRTGSDVNLERDKRR